MDGAAASYTVDRTATEGPVTGEFARGGCWLVLEGVRIELSDLATGGEPRIPVPEDTELLEAEEMAGGGAGIDVLPVMISLRSTVEEVPMGTGPILDVEATL
jgi:hypothetical protein